ncbi:MAG: DUF2997 domain-containing protein [Caldilinea sp.]
MAKITILVDKQGDVNIDVTGVRGPSCQALTRELQARIGATKRVVHKPELFEPPPKQTQELHADDD